MSDDVDSFAMDFDGESKRGFRVPESLPLDPPILQVYLASPLTNLDQHSLNEAPHVRAVIKDVFGNYECNGIRFEVYDPADHSPPGSLHSNEAVYLLDHTHVSNSDLAVFWVAANSLGVGMEAQIASGCTLPRVVVARKDSRVSRMFLGASSPTIGEVGYENLAELRDLLSNQMPSIARAAIDSAGRRRAVIDEYISDIFVEKIMLRRFKLGLTIHKIAKDTDIAESLLKGLERNPSLARSLTNIQTHRIMVALGGHVKCDEKVALEPVFEKDPVASSPAVRDSFQNLIKFIRQEEEYPSDHHLLNIWREYAVTEEEQEREAIWHRDRSDEAITVDEWRRKYRGSTGRLF